MNNFLGKIKNKKEIKRKMASIALKKSFFLGIGVTIFLFILCGGLYILFRPYTITLDLNDGTETVLTENYTIGSGKITLGQPERKGFRFTGWTGTNVSKENINVVVGNGRIGNLSYKANWSDELNVTCEDWIIDAEGNLIENITSKVDEFLKAGKSTKEYQVVERKITVKSGSEKRGADWGGDKSYKVYHSDYMYVGDSGKTKITDDGTVVYRYFYPVFDVNYLLDGARPNDAGIKDGEVGTFNLFIDGKLKKENITDFCGAVAYGSVYEVVSNQTFAGYRFVTSATDTGKMGTGRKNIDINYESLNGSYKVTCEDWVVDAEGNRVRNITGLVDVFLQKGGSSKSYTAKKRTIMAKYGDVVNAESWGKDKGYKAYHSSYMYVGSSGDTVIEKDGTKVYRYFYPVLDLGAVVDGKGESSISHYATANLYVDGKLWTEDIKDFCSGVPSGSEYRFEISGYSNYTFKIGSSAVLSGVMGTERENIDIPFEKRSGDSFVTLEDWVVDVNGNRVREISSEIDSYLKEGNSTANYSVQDRKIIVDVGESITPKLFGHDKSRGAFSKSYVYAGASGSVVVDTSGMKIYRYFYPVLDINSQVGDKKNGNTDGIATFTLYVDDEIFKINSRKFWFVTDFCYGIPVGAKYEVKGIRTKNGYTYIDDGVSSGIMEDTPVAVYLQFSKDEK